MLWAATATTEDLAGAVRLTALVPAINNSQSDDPMAILTNTKTRSTQKAFAQAELGAQESLVASILFYHPSISISCRQSPSSEVVSTVTQQTMTGEAAT